jgi:hypothetical protein
MRYLVCLLLLAGLAASQEAVMLDGKPALLLENDKLALTIRKQGGALAQLVLKDDPERVNPLHARLGHFVCVDGFGPVSPEERKAGLPGHGEANRVPWELVAYEKKGGILTASFTAALPIVHEIFRRTIRMVEGENVIYVDSELESLLGFDRPINWGEHATIGPPFLELGKTTVEMSAKRGMTRSWESQSEKPHRLASQKEFAWPDAPGINGEVIDVRAAPAIPPVGDHTTSQMDPARKLVFVTAFHPEKRLLLGYVFRREEYPWTQLWEWYPDAARSARGLEFATQPFDLPRREVIEQNPLFGTPTFRWLPAKSKISSAFVIFYTRTPEGFGKVDDVVLEGGRLTIDDRGTGKRITLIASRAL